MASTSTQTLFDFQEQEARRLLRSELDEFGIVKLVESYGEGYLNLDKQESEIITLQQRLNEALSTRERVAQERVEQHLEQTIPTNHPILVPFSESRKRKSVPL